MTPNQAIRIWQTIFSLPEGWEKEQRIKKFKEALEKLTPLQRRNIREEVTKRLAGLWAKSVMSTITLEEHERTNLAHKRLRALKNLLLKIHKEEEKAKKW